MNRRRRKEKIALLLMRLSLALVLLSLSAIVLMILVRGFPSLSLSMLFETPRGGYYLGKEGGIANAIVGSLCLGFGASIIALCVSIPAAIALQKEYSSRRVAGISRIVLDILWGTPSIVYGAFAFVVMVYFGLRASLLGGILTLAFLMLPVMVRSMEEVIRMIPKGLREMAYSLGATRLETTLSILLRQALPGIITAILLAFGRAIGDAASILFTAGYTDYMPGSLLDPVASLPLAIFFQIGTPFPEVQERAYAAALILFVMVLAVNLAARFLGARLSRNIIR
jgi:phosphate transport system permease protein